MVGKAFMVRKNTIIFFILAPMLCLIPITFGIMGPDLEGYSFMLAHPERFASVSYVFIQFSKLFSNVYILFFVNAFFGLLILGWASNYFADKNGIAIWLAAISFPFVGFAFFNAARGTLSAALIALGMVLLSRNYRLRGVIIILFASVIHPALGPYLMLSLFSIISYQKSLFLLLIFSILIISLENSGWADLVILLVDAKLLLGEINVLKFVIFFILLLISYYVSLRAINNKSIEEQKFYGNCFRWCLSVSFLFMTLGFFFPSEHLLRFAQPVLMFSILLIASLIFQILKPSGRQLAFFTLTTIGCLLSIVAVRNWSV